MQGKFPFRQAFVAALMCSWCLPHGFARPDRLRFGHPGSEEGISHRGVYRMAQDSREFLWIALKTGLNRNKALGNENATAIPMIIAAPFWKSYWAFALYGIVACLLVYWYLQRQNRKWRLERRVVESLRRNDELKDEFLANTSHELRTPLNGIIGIVESLLDGVTGPLPEKTAANLEMVASSARRLAHMVNDLLDFSNLKSGSLKLNRKAVSLHALADVVLALSKPLSGHKELSFHNEIPANCPAVFADEDRLHQILHNLVGNAVKFTPKGRIAISATAGQGRVAVSVIDTGIGIDEEKKELIFGPFQQGDGSISRLFGGTGLGLAITQRLVRLHDGAIFVESEPGKGATFTFTLPMADTGQLPSPTTRRELIRFYDSNNTVVLPEPRGIQDEAAGEKSLILVVDDDPVNLQVIVNHLSLIRAEVRVAADGEEALTLLDANPGFDLVILDVMMPRLSGYTVCRRIRETHAEDELPVIMLTAKTRVEDLVEGFNAGANDYLPKPVSKKELLTRIQTHLKLQRTGRDLRRSKQKLEHYSRDLADMVETRTRDLINKHQELATFEKIVREINRKVTLKELLSQVLEQSMVLFPKAEKGLLVIADPASRSQETLTIMASVGYREEEIKHRTIHTDDLLANFREGIERIERGVYRIEPLPQGATRLPGMPDPLSRVAMDIRIDNRQVGFMVLDNDHVDRAFQSADFEKLIRLREHVISAIIKARHLEELKRKNEQILKTQEQLVEAAHHAGMAEIAANVLHNVGNALSSVKTSANLVLQALDNDQALEFYGKLVDLMIRNRNDLGHFFSGDPRAKRIPDAMERVRIQFRKYYQQLNGEMKRLNKNIFVIDTIVQSQREYTGVEGLLEEVDLNRLVENVLNIQRYNLRESGIHVATELEDLPSLKLQKSKLLQILAHLILNAEEALESRDREKLLRLRTCRNGQNQVMLEVIDNGSGIDRQNLTRIFTQGFSTKKGRHGFGLHFCANAMAEMKGGIDVASEGAGKGAKFTLKFTLPHA